MIKKVGFDRALKVEWLNTAAEIYRENKEPAKARVAIKDYLNDKIVGKVSKSKCPTILMNTWVNVHENHKAVCDMGLNLYDIANGDEKIILHWGALMMAYPIFTDIASVIGRSLYLNETFNISSVKKRIYEIWGQNSTIDHDTAYVILTMLNMGAISHSKKTHIYRAGKTITTDNPEFKLFLINSYMLATEKNTLLYENVEYQYPLFPFKIDLKTHEINESDTLKLNRFDNQIFIMMN